MTGPSIAVPQSELERYADAHPDAANYTNQQIIDQIARPWNFAGQTTITYGFPEEQTANYAGTGADGLLFGFTQNQIDATKQVLAYWDDVIAPSFVIYEQGDPLGDTADTRFFNRAQPGTATGGYTGDVHVYNYDTTDPETRVFTEGYYQFQLMVHEVGHTLGLDHSFTAPYEGGISYLQDSNIFSTMAYTTRDGAGATGAWLMPTTPMLVDILVAQSIYGADMTTRTGDSVYGFNSNIADRPAFDFDAKLADGHPIGPITIWDAGGIDTLDFSGFSTSVLDLRDGQFSSADGNSMLVSIAYNAIIENAVGSTGEDTIFGNAVANMIRAGGGADIVIAGDGDDTVHGDNGGAATPAVGEIRLVEINPSATPNGSGHFYNDHYFEPATAVSLPGTAITMEMVLQLDVKPGAYATIFHYTPSDANNGEWDQQLFSLRLSGNGTQLTLQVAGQSIDTGISPDLLVGSEPMRLSVTWDSADGNYAIFINGVEKGSGTIAAGATIPADGYLHFMSGWWMQMQGSIGDIRIWDHVRDQADILADAFVEASGAETGLVALWQADDLSTNALANAVAGSAFPALQLQNNSVSNPASLSTYDMGNLFADQIDGGAGNDTIFGEAGNDILLGGSGDDTISGGAGHDTIDGGEGNDTIICAVPDIESGETVYGGAGFDTLMLSGGGVFDLGLLTLDSVEAICTDGTDTQVIASSDMALLLAEAGGSNDQLTLQFAAPGHDVNALLAAANAGYETISFVERQLDGSARITSDNVLEVTLSDTGNNYAYASLAYVYDAAGALLSFRIHRENGSMFDRSFDAAGRVTSEMQTDAVSGSGGAYAWQTHEKIYSGGLLSRVETLLDNGLAFATDYNSSGVRTSTTVLDGNDGDATDVRIWQSLVITYDGTTGARTQVDYTYDSSAVWQSAQLSFGANGLVTETVHTRADGTLRTATFDASGALSFLDIARGDGLHVQVGYAGNDMISSGAGDDFMVGGVGNDTFIFGNDGGLDRVRDFDDNGNDMLDLTAFGVTSLADLDGAIAQAGAHVVIDLAELGGAGSILLYDTSLDTIGNDDFVGFGIA